MSMTDLRGNSLRRVGWFVFAALAVTHVLLVMPLSGERADPALSWGLGMVPMALSPLGAFAVFLRVRGEERRFWGLLALATALLLVSESYFVYWVVMIDPLGPLLPHPFELIQVAAAALFFAVVMSMTRFGAQPIVVRLRYYLDVMAVSLLGYVVVYRFVVDPLFLEIPRRTLGLVLIGSAYPVLGTAMIVVTFSTLVGFKVYRWRPWERLFAISITIYSLGILGWPWWYLAFQTSADPRIAGSVLEYVFTAGHYLLFMASLYRLTQADIHRTPHMATVVSALPRRVFALIPGALTLAVPLVLVFSLGTNSDEVPRVTLGIAVALAVLLAVRSWLVDFERSYLRRRMLLDPLTGLGNRRAFESALHRSVADAGQTVALVALDVDGFRHLNDAAGHAEGDRVLVDVARIAVECLGSGAGTVYRISGDDLLMLAPGLTRLQATTYAECCIARVSEEVTVGYLPVSLTAGIAVFPLHADRPVVLLRHALVAQQRAKASGVRLAVYDDADGDIGDTGARRDVLHTASHSTMVHALASAIDARNPRSRGHARAVADTAILLAGEIGLDAARVKAIETASLLHDIGRLACPSRNEQQALAPSDESYHAVLSEKLLMRAGVAEMLPWIRGHHECWDGSGGPDGHARGAIPLEARLIAVCDAFDTLKHGRDGTTAYGHHGALRALELDSGKRFDPTLVGALVRLAWGLEEPFAAPAS